MTETHDDYTQAEMGETYEDGYERGRADSDDEWRETVVTLQAEWEAKVQKQMLIVHQRVQEIPEDADEAMLWLSERLGLTLEGE